MSPLPLLQSTLGNLRSWRLSRPLNPEAPPWQWLGYLGTLLPTWSARTGWLVYTLVCFAVSLVFTFPTSVLLQRVIASVPRDAGVRVRYTDGDCTGSGGCVFRDLILEGPALAGSTVQFSRLAVNPSLWSLLLRGQPWPLIFSADGYGGIVEGTVRQIIGGVSTRLSARHLALERLPLLAPWGQGRVIGKVIVDGELSGNPADLYSLQGAFTATVTDGALQAGTVNGVPLPALQTVQASLRVSLAGGRLEIAELRLNADGVEVLLQGGVALRTPIARSGLDMQLTTRSTTDSLPPALRTLLALLPPSQTTPGERQASLTGSLGAPVVR
jgi:type II secretion system protein N